VNRNGHELLVVKVPRALAGAALTLPADDCAVLSYEDDQTKSGPGQVALGDVTVKRQRVIYGDDPAEPPETP